MTTRDKGSKFPDIFAALAAEFDPREVKTLPAKGSFRARYITARTAMNRLDNVLGPENWWDDYTPGAESVMCRLTIRLPDGSTVTKCDAGGYAGMSDKGDDDKSGFSDAFKRACARFGVARYIYGDGIPDFRQPAPPATAFTPDNKTGHGTGAYMPPEVTETYESFVKSYVEQCGIVWADHWSSQRGGETDGIPENCIVAPQLAMHLVKHFRSKGLVNTQPDEKMSLSKAYKLGAVVWTRNPDAVQTEAERYFHKCWGEAAKDVKAKLAEASPRDPLYTEDDDEPFEEEG